MSIAVRMGDEEFGASGVQLLVSKTKNVYPDL